MASITDVARIAGVSTATVSRSFSSPEMISAKTRTKVLDVASQLNYSPRISRAATRVVRASKSLPGEMLEYIGFQFFAAEKGDRLAQNGFYAPILSGAQAEAAALEQHLLLHETDRHAALLELPKMVVDRAVAGLLLVGTADPMMLALFAEHVPHIVLVDNHDETGAYESVVSDGFNGARAATRFLLELGHTNLAFFAGENDVNFLDRVRGFQTVMFEAGLPQCARNVITGFGKQVACEALTAVLAARNAPTALVTSNDYYAMEAMKVTRRLGLRIPDDLSLIGFDDLEMCTHTVPMLTTVAVNKEYMGRLAVRRLYARMHGAYDHSNEPAVINHVPVKLVVRESCGPPHNRV